MGYEKMTVCRTCGERVAKKARNCPHCGERTPGRNPAAGVIAFLFGMAFIVMVVASASS